MSLADLKGHFRVDSDFSTGEKRQISLALKNAYTNSPTARAMLDELASSTTTITITKKKAFESNRDSDTLFIDSRFLDGLVFIDEFGEPGDAGFQISLLHELVHLIKDTTDPTPQQLSQHDYAGDTVRIENAIRTELHLNLRPTYYNIMDVTALLFLPPEFEKGYTNGQKVDIVIVTSNKIGHDHDTSGLGPTRDLMIGFGDTVNVFKSGSGRDFLYGFAGNDILDGGDSEDFLFGGAHKDILIGGGGDNTMDGGSGKDIAELTGFKFNHTLTKSGGTSTYVNQETTEINILKNIETVRFTASNVGLPAEITSAFVGTDSATVLARNDDGYEEASLSAAFEKGLNFFGTKYTSVFVNNNGNLTFGGGLSGYTPGTIGGSSGLPIIAAFWADVDTRGSTGSVSYGYNSAHDSFVATWSGVDYYNTSSTGHVTKSNSYQIEIFDQGAGDAEIIIRYGDLNWTTGDASGGSGGLGGSVARAGLNSGNPAFQFEMPGSGTAAAMLALDSTTNCGRAGVWRFSVHNGTIIEDALASDRMSASDYEWAFV